MGGPLVLHLLTAASLPELLRLQLRLSPGPAAAPPPLSSLGLQLCRSTGDPRDFRRDVKGMTEASIPLQFDGDCIDEQLIKTAFELNPAYSTLENDFSLLADSHDALTKLDKHRRHVDIHVELIVASQPNVDGRDLDGLAPLAQMVELLPYQPARLDGSVHSQGVVDLGGPGLSSQVGLVTVDQAPVAVVITGLACVAQ